MVQTWVRDRWYDHNCGENHGIKCEPASSIHVWPGPLRIHDRYPISLKHANMVLSTKISKGRKQVLYQETGNSIPIIWALQEQHSWGKRDTEIYIYLYIYRHRGKTVMADTVH